jgi:hypothetical protein
MLEIIVGIIVIIAWIVFYIAAAIAINIHLGGYACVAFIAFFIGFVLTKIQAGFV